MAAPGLQRVVTSEALAGLAKDHKLELMSLLPEGQQTEEELAQTLRSPQLRQSLVHFTRALRDEGAFPMILSSLGLELTSEAMRLWQAGDEVGAFVLLLMNEAKANAKKDGGNQD